MKFDRRRTRDRIANEWTSVFQTKVERRIGISALATEAAFHRMARFPMGFFALLEVEFNSLECAGPPHSEVVDSTRWNRFRQWALRSSRESDHYRESDVTIAPQPSCSAGDPALKG